VNNNVTIALLELRGVITHEEALRIVEHIAARPQSNDYNSTLATIKPLLDILGNLDV
jgi:hypothetical protein